jgi:hydrogenase maturation protease
MSEKSLLILGVGNLLLGDEGAGIHAVQRLQQMNLPPEVEVIDGGTGGFELIDFCRGRKKIIIIDAMHADAEPGDVFRFSLEEAELQWPPSYSAHQTGLRELLHFCKELDPQPEVIIYGIVPEKTNTMTNVLSKTVSEGRTRLVGELSAEVKRTIAQWIVKA